MPSIRLVVLGMLALSVSCASPDKQPEVTGTEAPPPTAAATTPPAATHAPAATASEPSSNPAMSDVITIEKNTQATVQNLKVGAGNFWEEDYTPEGGSPKKGITAGLWVMVKGEPDQHVRVHPGKVVTAPGWRIEVMGVDERAVRVAIKKTAP